MRKHVVGLAQMKVRGAKEENTSKAVEMVRRAADQGAEVVCLPELFATEYFPKTEGSKLRPEPIPSKTTSELCEAAKREGVIVVAGTVYESDGRDAYNSSLIISEKGNVLGRYRKVHIPEDPGFYEQGYFKPGEEYLVCKTRVGRIAVLICYDQWYPEAARTVRLMGAELIFYPTAIGTVKGIEQSEGDWQAAWEAVQRGHAISNSVVVAAVNRAGIEGDTNFWGGSFVYDQFGTLLGRAGAGEEVLVTDYDLDLGKDIEKGWGFLRNRRPETYGNLVK